MLEVTEQRPLNNEYVNSYVNSWLSFLNFIAKGMLSLKISSIIFLFMKSKCANFA